ncbi:MAG: tetratricopeptide (TPR) repeat protein [Chlamydiales bacterium]|jgi:tetratricopeptide (TPR) repeat protein
MPANSPEDPSRAPWLMRRPWLAGLLLAMALGGLYGGTLHGPFLFDDTLAIIESPNIESLTPISRALDAPEGSGADRRPLVALSLALNHAAGGRDPYGYHAVNLGLHILAALTLLGLIRQTLLLRSERDGKGTGAGSQARATALGFVLTLMWSVHPLHTSTLHMVINRNELMSGLFTFLTLYASARSLRVTGSREWTSVAIVACLLGAASKEVVAAVPLIVLLYDRLFHSPSLGKALRSNRALYAGLALTWVALALLATTGSRGESAGFGLQGFSSLDYLMTQTGALLHYLSLTFWPRTLAFDYAGWPVPEGLSQCWRQGLAVVALLALSVVSWKRGTVAGFLGLSCFLILSPSSSFIPLSGALVAEHRMYIPAAALLAAAACVFAAGVTRALPRAGATTGYVLALAVAASFAARTVVRNRDFESARSLWGATVDVRPDNGRAWNSYGMALNSEGLTAAATHAYERALAIDPRHYRALVNLGNIHFGTQDWATARPLYERALARKATESDPYYYLGVIAVNQGDARAGVGNLRRALDGDLSSALRGPAAQSLAWTLATTSDAQVRDGQAALELARALDRESPGRNPRVLDALAAALAETGDLVGAEKLAAHAAQLARARNQSVLAKQLEAHRQAYATGSPWRTGP